METKHYVPLEIARRLRAKGYHADRYATNEMALPTYEQATDWFCRKFGIEVYVITESGKRTIRYYGSISPHKGNTAFTTNEPTKEQAMNIAIIKALELI